MLYLGPKTDGQPKLSHSSPFQWSQGSQCYQVLAAMIRKIKGHIFASDLQDDEKHLLLFFPSRVDSFNSQFCFHETQGRSDNSTGKKKKVHPSFRSENSQMKRIFLKSKQVGFSALYLPVKTNMYFVLSLNTEQVDRAERPSVLFIHLRSTPSLQRNRHLKPVTCN